jgi:hypothetical protein
LSSDKHNNIYALCSFDSSSIRAYSFENVYRSENRYSVVRDVAVIKYLTDGSIDWITKVGFNDNFVGSPSIYTDAEGNSYVTVVKTSTDGFSDIYIFDTRNSGDSIKTVSLESNGASLIKYDKDGVYLWDIRISGDGTYETKAVADKNGNVYMAGFITESGTVEISDTSYDIVDEINGSNGIFVVKFDKIGKYVWSVPLYSGVNTEASLSIVCDQEGNVIVSATQYDTVSVYNRVGNAIRDYGDINRITDSSNNIFMVKYDTDGKCLWTNRLGSNSGGEEDSGQSYLPSSAVDSYGNYYLAIEVTGGSVYIYDTRSVDTVRYVIAIPTSATENTFFAKYNKNGIVQWYNFVSGYSTTPNICVDNRFVRGISSNNVYLSGSYEGNGEPETITIYHSSNDGGNPSTSRTLTANNLDSYLLKFFDNGYLDWCSKVSGAGSDNNPSLIATSDGHVYFGGEFNSSSINVYQGSTLAMNPDTQVSTTINNFDESEENITYDIFLIKYNRYGTVNNGGSRLGREIYLENNNSIPDGTEKSIVIINNGEKSAA